MEDMLKNDSSTPIGRALEYCLEVESANLIYRFEALQTNLKKHSVALFKLENRKACRQMQKQLLEYEEETHNDAYFDILVDKVCAIYTFKPTDLMFSRRLNADRHMQHARFEVATFLEDQRERIRERVSKLRRIEETYAAEVRAEEKATLMAISVLFD